ncbi:MAG: fibronectin type III domain-containing protein [Candidatus Omnitrophota bacterium]
MIAKKKTIISVFFVLVLVWIFADTVQSAIPQKEREALIALYNSTNGDNWWYTSGWKTPPLHTDGFAMPGTENRWKGVQCNLYNNKVLNINLEQNNLTGTLPPELGNLSNLENLWLNSNQLAGPIPPELGSLSKLQWVNLDFNQLTGSIPPELGNLSELQGLHLDSNQLTGTIPQELGNLSNLYYLYLQSNQLNGQIPKELAKLPNLFHLALGSNLLMGEIPKELGNLPELTVLDLSSNLLAGQIPPELGNLVKLEWLILESNQLTGSIPSDLSRAVNITHFYLAFNQLSGCIPKELGDLSNCEIIWFNSNELSGNIPPELGALSKLEMLYLCSNRFEGSIPAEFGNLSKLKWVDVSSNKLQGIIPTQLQALSSLESYGSDFRWNALFCNDENLRTFLNAKQYGGNWENTQTLSPINVSAYPITGTSIMVSWTPISYIHNRGGYRLFYSQTHEGPYTLFNSTETKQNTSLEFKGVEPLITYYFVVQTKTEPHGDNRNAVESELSSEVQASTKGKDNIISGRICDETGKGIKGGSMIFTPGASTEMTDAEGYYRHPVEAGWSGTILPFNDGYTFEPKRKELNNVTMHQRGIDFKAKATNIMVKISGKILCEREGVGGIALIFTSNSGETMETITGVNGDYSFDLPYGWTGRVTPQKNKLIFYPPFIDYGPPGLTEDSINQNYQLSISLTFLQLYRHQENAVAIIKDYMFIEINAVLLNISPDKIKKFVILRRELSDEYIPIKEFPSQAPYRFSYTDKYLETSKWYIYICRALDEAGNIIGESKEIKREPLKV